jgi:CO/xanthine dehydrogenase Mo-binding subunit
LPNVAYFQGEQVGAVAVADSEDIADEALRQMEIEWEERPFVLDQEVGLQHDSPLARPERFPENNALPYRLSTPPVLIKGDLKKGFEEAESILEFKATRRYHGCPDTEIPCGISRWDGDCLEVWLHHQHPYEHKWVLHHWFNIPMNKIKVNSPYNGAMFGGWNWVAFSMITQLISAILARRTHRPVKWVFDRRDDFTFGQMTLWFPISRLALKRMEQLPLCR